MDAIVSGSFVCIDHVDRFCVLRNGQLGFEFEKMFLRINVSANALGFAISVYLPRCELLE